MCGPPIRFCAVWKNKYMWQDRIYSRPNWVLKIFERFLGSKNHSVAVYPLHGMWNPIRVVLGGLRLFQGAIGLIAFHAKLEVICAFTYEFLETNWMEERPTAVTAYDSSIHVFIWALFMPFRKFVRGVSYSARYGRQCREEKMCENMHLSWKILYHLPHASL